jgi:ATP/maltotriose-dependent transcriptional regulator MalT/DNA-binding SARP family transcriptional activator
MALRFEQKLIVPAVTSPLVERAQLIDQIERAVTTKRVVALAAPAGWGKTTTLAQWVAHSSLPVAWYMLDRGDHDSRIFLDYLLQAVARFVPGANELAQQLDAAPPQALPELFRQVALRIAAAREPFALVLDDLHALDDSPTKSFNNTPLVRELLVSLIDYALNCHLVLASRTLTSLYSLERLVRLGAQQRAAVFDYKALQFSPTDTQRLARLVSGAPLADERAEQLTSDLGGWVAGLVLSLSRPDGDNGLPAPDSADDTTPLYAFFAEQILAPLAPELQQFLEDTSVLDDLSPSRCDRLRASNDSADFLKQVSDRVLSISRRAGWLSYHSLFRDFLRTRLAQDVERERTLLRRAGELYRDEEELERALDCFLAADAEDDALGLMRAAIPRFRERSRHSTLLTCFERLSAALTQRGRARTLPPDLLLAQASVYADLALWDYAQMALQLAEAVGDEALRAEARVLHADMCCMRDDPERAQAIIDELQPTTLPPRVRLLYHFTNGRIQFLRGDIESAIAALEQSHALAPTVAEAASDPSLFGMIYDSLGAAYSVHGQATAAIRHLRRADACWQACGNHGRRTMTLNNLGMMALLERRYEEARTAFDTGLELARQTARRREEAFLCCSLAELDVLEGQLDQAFEHFVTAHALAVRADTAGILASAAVGAFWVATLQSDLAAMQSWQAAAEAAKQSIPAEARGRMALASALMQLNQPRPDLDILGNLAAEATASAESLQPLELACLALLRAAVALKQASWASVEPEWAGFAERAVQLPDVLLQRLVPPFGAVFEAASHTSQLARHLSRAHRAPTTARWRIRALGAFECEIDGLAIDLSPLHLALLVRLLDAGPEGISVERLWTDVWGDTYLSMPTLHQTLYRFRGQTQLAVKVRDGICAIRSDWDTIDYDVRTLEQLLAGPLSAETIEQATALYRGEFLPGAPLSAALWADARRSFIQQRFLNVLEQFAQAGEREAPDRAIHYYQHILQIDGCREQTAAQLMRLAQRIGNRSLVSATFEHLTGALRTVGATPQPSTTALYTSRDN